MSEDKFAKVHGPGYDPVNHLRTENARLQAQVQGLTNELVTRAQSRVAEVTDALNAYAQMANQGNPQAKALLTNLIQALDRAREATLKITVVRNGQG